jgi:RNA polymerase sigma-70 factor, ECF subfamily
VNGGHVLNDEALMMDVRAGSRTAFELLFERYRTPIWRFFRRRTADAGRAEELAQDAFLALLESARRYEPRAPFRAYLFGIAYNVLFADRRKAARQTTHSLDSDPPAPAAPDIDRGIWVRDAIQRLDDTDREVLMLREYEQLSYQEIAEVRGIPLNTVRSQLFRARMALKAALEVAPSEPVRNCHDGH